MKKWSIPRRDRIEAASSSLSSWSKEEKKILVDMYPKKGSDVPIDRSREAIHQKANEMGLKTEKEGRKWTEEEVEFLKRNYSEMTGKEIAEALGRTDQSVWGKARDLGLKSDIVGHGRRWSDEEKSFLEENYTAMTCQEIAEKLDRSLDAVFHQARKLGLAYDKNPFSGRKHDEETLKKIAKKSFPEKPTEPERKLMGIIEREGLPFKYVGDGGVWINGLNPDFIDSDGSKRLIEVFGEYFHSGDGIPYRRTEEGRKEAFSEFGFDTLVLWDYEIEELSDSEIADRIEVFRW